VRCGEELKVDVNYMDVDDANVEMECYKVSGNTLYLYIYCVLFIKDSLNT